jgi:hypothetical protein
VLKRFSFDQMAQIFLDKYDPRYRWRRPVNFSPGTRRERMAATNCFAGSF